MVAPSDAFALEHAPLSCHQAKTVVQGDNRCTKIAYFKDMLQTNPGMAKHSIALKGQRCQLRIEIRWLLARWRATVLG